MNVYILNNQLIFPQKYSFNFSSSRDFYFLFLDTNLIIYNIIDSKFFIFKFHYLFQCLKKIKIETFRNLTNPRIFIDFFLKNILRNIIYYLVYFLLIW
jgi:hypothetical protein